jgi:hypothetical protein
MSGPTTIPDEETATKRTGEALVYTFDYDENLATLAQLASVGAFTISPDDGQLTKDQAALVAGNRSVIIRLSGGKVGKTYRVSHSAVTTETPTQTLDKFFDLFIRP